MSPSSTIIRILADTARIGGVTDATTSTTPAFWRSSKTRVELALARRGTLFDSLATVASVTVEIKPTGTGGGAPAPDTAPLMSRTVSAAELTPITPDAWEDGTGQHASIEFSAEECNVPAGTHWLVISVVTFAGGSPFTGAAGQIRVVEDGYNSVGTAPAPDTTAWTKEEADARYGQRLGFAQRLADGAVMLFNPADQLWHRLTIEGEPPIAAISVEGYPSPLIPPAPDATDTGGPASEYTAALAPLPSTLPLRTADGRVKAAPPTEDDDVATLASTRPVILTGRLKAGANAYNPVPDAATMSGPDTMWNALGLVADVAGLYLFSINNLSASTSPGALWLYLNTAPPNSTAPAVAGLLAGNGDDVSSANSLCWCGPLAAGDTLRIQSKAAITVTGEMSKFRFIRLCAL